MKKQSEIKQTRMIGLRVADDLFHLIEDGAEIEQMSPTAFARITLARALGYENSVPETRPRRRYIPKPVHSELRAAVEVLSLLIDVRTALSSILAQNKMAQIATLESSPDLIRQGEVLGQLSAQIEVIRTHIIGVKK